MAEMWGGLLANSGIPFRLSPGDTSAFLGLSSDPAASSSRKTCSKRPASSLRVKR